MSDDTPLPFDLTAIVALQGKVQGLRDLVVTKFAHMEQQLRDLHEATEEASKSQARMLDKTRNRLDAYDTRLVVAEQMLRWGTYIGGIIVAIFTAVLIAIATGKATIVWK